MHLEMKNYNSSKYKTVYLSEFSLGKLQTLGHLFFTFDKQQFVNLYDGNAFEVQSRSVISLSGLFSQIRNVRNKHGHIIAKRKNPLTGLKKVRFQKR
ncbi:hypothetical protein IHV12_19725 [Fictibacillus sp. 7GRE50]|uniref:hypothetical protein n=1 Tax=Fictibacillus sp. 7GRE50 TaxID=2745878 RepID=UPI0018CE9934|nr:hypothetical protein [Fictibacillus sp. 7GRE50]MBH0167158.1 hypothetical protein [Fictibacillus sp. 7GRE50]